MPAKKKGSTSKRETLKSKNATFFVKRTAKGRFNEMDAKGRSLARIAGRAKKTVKSCHGDQGDRGRQAA